MAGVSQGLELFEIAYFLCYCGLSFRYIMARQDGGIIFFLVVFHSSQFGGDVGPASVLADALNVNTGAVRTKAKQIGINFSS